jgi:excisionase family DNA binding protein
MQADGTMTAEELIQELGTVPRRTVYTWLQTGRVPARRVGRSWLLGPAALPIARQLAEARRLLRGPVQSVGGTP